jgi:rhodanese-related sulfurtransferase
MFKKGIILLNIIILTLGNCNEKVLETISGNVVNGYREITLSSNENNFTVYRGDYIKFIIDGQKGKFSLLIPALEIEQIIDYDAPERSYTKMKIAGNYKFTLGPFTGTINVVEFEKSNYTELTADESKEMIRTKEVLILDVRTPNEFNSGHIKDAQLLPVQNIQRNLNGLNEFKDKEILIYCATGNRSTVASKILLDNGFSRVYNMRYGISDWVRNGNLVIK